MTARRGIIAGSVGAGGQNRRADTVLVQTLLNAWRAGRRLPPIAVDGVVGPQTIGAIRAYQQASTGKVDGRFDPNGPGIAKLSVESLAGLRAMLGNVSYFRPPMPPHVPGHETLHPERFLADVTRTFAALGEHLHKIIPQR